MGRSKSHRGGRKSSGRGRGGGGGNQYDRTDMIEKLDMNNDRFNGYYRAQKIVPDEEWDAFVDAMKRPLPTTFRVGGSRQTAHTLNSAIQHTYVPTLSNATFEGEQIPPPVQIPWYPEGLAWQFNVSKKMLRKSPEFKRFHSFLVFETDVGNISRSEAVSMLPPLFLGVEPHHLVMDMCAAPGSKTAQLLEALHTPTTPSTSSSSDHTVLTESPELSMPTGLLIANDSDHKRTHLLIHQSARLPSPAFIVTNLDASIYPILRIPALDNTSQPVSKYQQLLFDRILCDVPCSGDGTIRKNLGIWKSWQPGDGNGLHSLQLRILQRAMSMLKPTGRIVYSTCSLNPIENEAVVAQALKSNPAYELVDVSAQLPELVRRPGLTSWIPAVDKTAERLVTSWQEFSTLTASSTTAPAPALEGIEEVVVAEADKEDVKLAPTVPLNTKLTEGHWPPSDVKTLNLHRCIRIYPHLQDTGGFFVAVLQKKKTVGTTATDRKREAEESISVDIPESKKPRLEIATDATLEASVVNSDVNSTEVQADMAEVETETTEIPTAHVQKKLKSRPNESGGSFKENPYTFLSPDDPILKASIEQLHLTPSFPSSNVLVRNPAGDPARSLYLTNDIVKEVVLHNDYNRIRLTAAGTKVISKQEGSTKSPSESLFRILGEGLPVVLPYTDPKMIIEGDMLTLKTLVEAYYPLCAGFSQPFRGEVEARPPGSHIVRFPPGESDGITLTHDIVLPLWKSNVSVTLMIDKKAKSALSLRLFGKDITTAGRDAYLQKEKKTENVSALASVSVSAVGTPEPTADVEMTDTKQALEELMEEDSSL